MAKEPSGAQHGDAGDVREFGQDPLAHAFFSSVPPAPDLGVEGWRAEPLPHAQRLGMWATFGLLGLFAASALVFLTIGDLVVVVPAELGEAPAALPSLDSTAWRAPGAPAPSPVVVAASGAGPAALHAAVQPSGTSVALAAAALEAVETPSEQSHETDPVTHVTTAPAPESEGAAEADVAAEAPDDAPPEAAVAAPAVRASAGRTPASAAAAPTKAVSLKKRAYRALGRRRPEEAQRLAHQSLLIDPTDAGTYIVLGGARDALGDQPGARAAFQQCVARAQGPMLSSCRVLAR